MQRSATELPESRSSQRFNLVVSSSESLIHRARDLARPRLFGSSGETEVRQAVAEALAEAGWSVTEEPFVAHLTIDGVAPLGIALAAFFLILATVALPESPSLATAAASVCLFLSASLDRLAETILRQDIRLGPDHGLGTQSANLRATHPALCRSGSTLWIVAHLDAKRQRLPLLVRCTATLLSRVLGAIAALAVLGYLIVPSPTLLSVQRATFAIAALGAVTLLVNSSDGETDGAVDNAGSLAVLLEVANRLNSTPRLASNLRVELVATAGEEAGCLGAIALASAVGIEAGKPAVLNLEALGAGPKLLLIASPRKGRTKGAGASLAETVTAAAAEKRIPCIRWPLAPGFWADHRPFLREGLEAVTLCGLGRSITTIHTRFDRLHRLNGDALAAQAELVLSIVARLAETENVLVNCPNM